MSSDLKIFEINDSTTFDSAESEESQDRNDLKAGDRVTIYVDDQNVIQRIEIEPEEDQS